MRTMLNNKGMILATSYMVIMVLMILGGVYLNRTVAEMRATERYYDSAQAFWAAERGIAKVVSDLNNGIALVEDTYIDLESAPTHFPAGYCKYMIETDDTFTSKMVTVTAVSGSGDDANKTQRKLQVQLLRKVFDNTASAGGDIDLDGFIAQLDVFGKTRLSGAYSKSGIGVSSWFEDKQEGLDQQETTIIIPDVDGNGTPGQGSDFIAHFDTVVNEIREETLNDPDIQDADAKAVLIETAGTYVVYPQQTLVDKDIIYVRGPAPGVGGNAVIVFDATWQNNQDLTVIATGDVTYLEPLQNPSYNSRLNVICMGDYSEASVFYSSHESVVSAQEDASYVDIFEVGSSTGNIIVNDDITFDEIFASEDLLFSDRIKNGDIPPAFSASFGTNDLSGDALILTPMNWREDVVVSGS